MQHRQALVTKYWMVEALESYAEATDSASAAKVVKALVAHHKQMWLQLSAQAPAMNATKWGFGRYSDAIVGIQWLLDNGEGSTPDTAFLWDLLRLVRNESDAVMRNVSSADGGGYVPDNNDDSPTSVFGSTREHCWAASTPLRFPGGLARPTRCPVESVASYFCYVILTCAHSDDSSHASKVLVARLV